MSISGKEYGYGTRVRRDLVVTLLLGVAGGCLIGFVLGLVDAPPAYRWGFGSVLPLGSIVSVVGDLRRFNRAPRTFRFVGRYVQIGWPHGDELVPVGSLEVSSASDAVVGFRREEKGFVIQYGAGIRARVFPQLERYTEFRDFLADAHLRAKESSTHRPGTGV